LSFHKRCAAQECCPPTLISFVYASSLGTSLALKSWTSTLLFSEQSKNHHETKYTQAYVPTHGIPTRLLYHPNCYTSNRYLLHTTTRTFTFHRARFTPASFLRTSSFVEAFTSFRKYFYLCFFCPLPVGDYAEKTVLGNGTVGLQIRIREGDHCTRS
jgi:hypothetical protein